MLMMIKLFIMSDDELKENVKILYEMFIMITLILSMLFHFFIIMKSYNGEFDLVEIFTLIVLNVSTIRFIKAFKYIKKYVIITNSDTVTITHLIAVCDSVLTDKNKSELYNKIIAKFGEEFTYTDLYSFIKGTINDDIGDIDDDILDWVIISNNASSRLTPSLYLIEKYCKS